MAQPGASKEGDTTDKGAAMDPSASLEQFLHTGRTGRRNAVPDLGDEKVASLSTADLPGDMAALSCSDKDKKDSKAEEAKS